MALRTSGLRWRPVLPRTPQTAVGTLGLFPEQTALVRTNPEWVLENPAHRPVPEETGLNPAGHFLLLCLAARGRVRVPSPGAAHSTPGTHCLILSSFSSSGS